MKQDLIKADGMLLIAAVIWGFAFVAQRLGMVYMGPFTFNGIRFVLGSLSILPLLFYRYRGQKEVAHARAASSTLETIRWGLAVGVLLYGGASLQQVGLVYTSAGKAGFITGLYVVLVPLLGLFWGVRPDPGTWIGAALAAVGLYLLSVTESFTISPGDLLVLIGALFWACHVLLIGWLTRRHDALLICLVQFITCSALSLVTALFTESITVESIKQAAVPLFYGGFVSVGIAYTLQVVAQRHSPPAHAAILLSLESFFAAVGGWFILGETLSLRAMTGCALMMAAMFAAQMQLFLLPTPRAKE